MSTDPALVHGPENFEHLAAARRQWIETVLRPWCRKASASELRKAELEWLDIAGRVDAVATLWTWAWERFPDLVHPDLPGVDETHCVEVTFGDGSVCCGYPDARRSQRGMLVLLGEGSGGESTPHGPFAIDQIRSVRRTE